MAARIGRSSPRNKPALPACPDAHAELIFAKQSARRPSGEPFLSAGRKLFELRGFQTRHVRLHCSGFTVQPIRVWIYARWRYPTGNCASKSLSSFDARDGTGREEQSHLFHKSAGATPNPTPRTFRDIIKSSDTSGTHEAPATSPRWKIVMFVCTIAPESATLAGIPPKTAPFRSARHRPAISATVYSPNACISAD